MDARVRIRLVPLRILLPTLLVAGVVGIAPPAGANHVAGGTYNGAVTGGGSITFSVSGDGTMVTSLTVSGVPACPGTYTFSNLPIDASHAFTGTSGNASVNGTFPSVGTAAGDFAVALTGCQGRVPWTGQLGPCECDDVTLFTKRLNNIFSFDERNNRVTNWFKTKKTITCLNGAGACEAKLTIQVDSGFASVPRGERTVRCRDDTCPAQFRKTFEWRLRAEISALRPGKVRKVRGRFKVECGDKTIFVPFVIGLKGSGRVSAEDTDYGNPA
jgi:hypothetical protein